MGAQRTGQAGDDQRRQRCHPSCQEETVEVIDSKTLLGDRDRVIIAHEGRRYVLRRTRLGKLILTM